MNEQLRFIQFAHPGREHTLRNGQAWHRAARRHARKFMQVNGRWLSSVEDEEHSGQLRFWGEWEAQSCLVEDFDCSSTYCMMPNHLWIPYYSLADGYEGLHNTDPFVFGDHFLYSNCRQFPHQGLRYLAKGSVIVFGSGKEIRGERSFLVDTVFVVGKRLPYDPQHVERDLRGKVSDTFIDVTGKPLKYACCAGEVSGCVPGGTDKLSLYCGANPQSRVHGMFSFFPAKPEGDAWDFAKPEIRLSSDYFNPGNWQAPMGVNADRSCSELSELWHDIAEQVLAKGLVLGTYAEIPPERS